MAPTRTALRRTLFLLLLSAGIGAAMSWRRSQSSVPEPTNPPQWPPIPTSQPVADTTWLPTNSDGTAPDTHPIKVKLSSGIFHQPGGRFYDRTRADRCYSTAAAAEADGYRRSKT